MTHSQMLQALHSGQLLLGVEPAQARRLFTDIPTGQLVGQRVDGAKALVSSVMSVEHLSFLTSLILAGFVWHWHALWIIPVTFIVHTASKSQASMGCPNLITPLLLVGVASWCAWHFRTQGTLFVVWCILTVSLPFWSRLVYRLATRFVLQLVLRSEYAYDNLRESVLILRET